jgi:hypothetical protein
MGLLLSGAFALFDSKYFLSQHNRNCDPLISSPKMKNKNDVIFSQKIYHVLIYDKNFINLRKDKLCVISKGHAS